MYKKLFFQALYGWILLSALTKDCYSRKRIKAKAQEFWFSFHDFDESLYSNTYVVQYKIRQRLFLCLQEMVEFLDLLLHLKLAPIPSLLLAKKRLLNFWFKLLDADQEEQKTKLEKLPEKKQPELENPNGPLKTKERSVSFVVKEKVEQALLDFLVGKRSAYAQDFFATLAEQVSQRTIYRYLNKMVNRGLIKKSDTNPPFFYLPEKEIVQ